MADFDAMMKKLKEKVETRADRFLELKISEAEGISPEVHEFVRRLKRHALAGKMMRELGMILAYRAKGGNDEDGVIEASTALTMLQAYLLIHDDIMDSAETRRGNPSVWAEFRSLHQERFRSGHRRFGESVAIIAGDLFESWGVSILAGTHFPFHLRIRAILAYEHAVQMTGYGQYLDIYTGECSTADEETVEKIHRYKTAIYTVDLPLRLGFILAGADEDELRDLWGFTLPLGIAFQMTDDIIDLYGDRKKLGKPLGGDIKEGKKTIMLLYALEHADRNELIFLKKCIGNKNITPEDINYIRGIIKRSGGYDYAKQKANAYFEESITALGRLNVSPEGREMLSYLANKLVDRSF
jgi:geranylgeranyl diphosphate synthase type I